MCVGRGRLREDRWLLAVQRLGELLSSSSSFKVYRSCIFEPTMKLAAKHFFLPGDLVANPPGARESDDPYEMRVAPFVRPDQPWRRRLALPGPCA
jgi:hypothetical protein